MIGGDDAVGAPGRCVLPSAELPALWDSLADREASSCASRARRVPGAQLPRAPRRDRPLLRAADRRGDRAGAGGRTGPTGHRATAALLRKRSPLMLHVTLEHVRRART
jgi:hypothetical protein